MPPNEKNGWNEWSKLVLSEIEKLTESNKEIVEGFQTFKIEVAKEIASKEEVTTIRAELSDAKMAHTTSLNDAKEELKKEISDVKADHAKELSEIKNNHDVQIARLETELKLKAGVWGAGGSLIGVLIMIAIAVFG